MERGKVIAILTGAISIILAIAYLVLVQVLDFRGEMRPAPITPMLAPTGVVCQLGSGCTALIDPL